MPEPVRETRQMLALMNPLLDADDVVFCTTADKALAEKAGRSRSVRSARRRACR